MHFLFATRNIMILYDKYIPIENDRIETMIGNDLMNTTHANKIIKKAIIFILYPSTLSFMLVVFNNSFTYNDILLIT